VIPSEQVQQAMCDQPAKFGDQRALSSIGLALGCVERDHDVT
jgi:hypothetical protein